MSISLSVAMMAHPTRAEQVQGILAALDRDDVQVIWDERNSRWDTGKRAMLAYDRDCSHHAVIQDDVLVCRDLFAGMERALEHVPDDAPLCGYVGKVRPMRDMVTAAAMRANLRGASFLTMENLNWGPLIIVPTSVIPEMIAYSDKLKDVPNYDRRLSRYFEGNCGILTWYTWPSVVDHADGPSLVPGRFGTDRINGTGSRSRVAHTFLGEEQSALDIDWSGPVIHAALPQHNDYIVMRHRYTGQEVRLRPTSPRIRRLTGTPSWEMVR